jgi:hypothetical protein
MSMHQELFRLALSVSPSVALLLIGIFSLYFTPFGAAIVLGAGIALLLSLSGGLIIAASVGRSLPVAASASLASFVIRIGGAGIFAILVADHPYMTWVLATFALGLLLTLFIDLLTWARVALSTAAPVTPAKESARA